MIPTTGVTEELSVALDGRIYIHVFGLDVGGGTHLGVPVSRRRISPIDTIISGSIYSRAI